MKPNSPVRFFKFAVVGGSALLIKLLITYILTDHLGLWYFASFLIATFIVWTLTFFANGLFTFAERTAPWSWRRYGTFMLGYLSIFWVNALIVFALTSLLFVPYLISIAAASLATSVATFAFSHSYVYPE